MMDKKGAIEFSMTTIMVVIIGVAVLALGLTWIRSTFEQVGGITEGSLEAAETTVGEVAFSGKVSAPASLNIGKSDIKKFKVLVRNQGVAGGFTVETELDSSPTWDHDGDSITPDKDCLTSTTSIGPITIAANDVGEFSGSVISDSGCSTGETGVVGIDIDGPSGIYATESIIVRIN
jgi:hypothetical protein